MSNKMKVFVCFDYDNDKHYKNLLKAWDANPEFDFYFSDFSSQEIQSNSVATVKQALSTKINQANYTLVLVGKEGNYLHKDRKEIGYKNWQNYEIAKSKDHNNKFVAVKLSKDNTSPEELLNAGASWAMSFTQEAIVKAMTEAVKKAA
ncbi:MAG: TIR domain-containing protein [Candidatus Pacebacteria bacterium]|nr:TIR domain-containing protein [Candidatus Paceibacterota bacterium]